MSPGPESFLSSLREDARDAVERLQELGRRLKLDLYVVGGAVRDYLLEVEVRDLDLVWLGTRDPSAVAEEFGRVLDATVRYHPEFLTASLIRSGGLRIDLGRARAEDYAAPAALPSVRPAALDADLARRDFSINAIAVPLFGLARWVDPCRGVPDVERRLLRTLHEESFRDDPTRILRGCELAVRRDLSFETETRRQIERAVGSEHLARVSGARIRHELARLLGAPERAAAGASKLREVRVDRALHPSLSVERAGVDRLVRLASWHEIDDGLEAETTPSFFVVALAALSWDRAPEERRALGDWLHLRRADRVWLERAPERLAPLVEGIDGGALESSEMDMATLSTQLSSAEARMATLLMPSRRAQRFGAMRASSDPGLDLSGADLLAAGIGPGPRVGKALAATLAARRAGVIGADGELEYALSWLRDHDPQSGE